MLLLYSLGTTGVIAGYQLFGPKNKKKNELLVKKLQIEKANPAQNNRPKSLSANVVNEEKAIHRKLMLSGLTFVATIIHTPLLLVVGFPLGFYLSLEFFQAGYRELFKERRIGVGVIDTITCGILLISGQIFALVFFLVILFISQKFLLKTKDRSEKNLTNVFEEQPRTVWIKQDDIEVEIPFEKLQVGDAVVIRAGGIIPVDGVIIEGEATIDQHALTGESMAVEKGIGERVLTATIVVSGKILIRVEQTGYDTVAARIGEILYNTADFKSSLETRGEQIANQSALPTIALGGLTYVLLGPTSAVAVLMAYFGYNMRISAPLSVLHFLQAASSQGILVKDGRALETLIKVDTVVFDKTGTLTENRLQVSKTHSWAGYKETEVLGFAAAAEYRQTHPIAIAILEAADREKVKIPVVDETTYEIGFGLQTKLNNQIICVGSERFMTKEKIILPVETETVRQSCQQKGYSLVYVALNQQLIGVIEMCPIIRPEAKQVIDQLKQRNLTTYIISGDYEAPTRHLAEELGIPHYFAETLPEKKSDLIEQLQEQGKTVCFIGDGINDAVALKTADVSISLQGASTVAVDVAQVVLMRQNLAQLPQLLEIADELDTNMKHGLLTTIVPGVFCVCGVYFFNFGIFAAIVLYNVGLAAGVLNALYPRLMDLIGIKVITNDKEPEGMDGS